MKQPFRKHVFGSVLLAVSLSFFVIGQALAWQYDQPYVDGLWGLSNGQAWSPYKGGAYGFIEPRLRGDGGFDSQGKRATQPLAQYVKWNQQAINWMRANSGSVSVTFHSSWNGNTGPTGTGSCSNWWQAVSWASTSMPGASAEVVRRNCGYTFFNEIRIYGDKNQLVADKDYFAQSWYQDTDTANDPKGQFNVDTYWNGSGNYHQKYCIPDNSNTAGGC